MSREYPNRARVNTDTDISIQPHFMHLASVPYISAHIGAVICGARLWRTAGIVYGWSHIAELGPCHGRSSELGHARGPSAEPVTSHSIEKCPLPSPDIARRRLGVSTEPGPLSNPGSGIRRDSGGGSEAVVSACQRCQHWSFDPPALSVKLLSLCAKLSTLMALV